MKDVFVSTPTGSVGPETMKCLDLKGVLFDALRHAIGSRKERLEGWLSCAELVDESPVVLRDFKR